MDNRGNVDNLKPLGPSSSLSDEEQFAIRSKGGKESVKSRRRKKSMKEVAQLLLSLKLQEDSDLEQELKNMGIEDTELFTNQTALIYVLFQKAILESDTKAIQMIIDLTDNNTQFNESKNERQKEFKKKMDLAEKEYELHKQKMERDDW